MSKYGSNTADDLLDFLFDGQPHLLASPMSEWLGSSRRFAAFVMAFRDKIRKKLRVTQNEETLYDLRLELETAYLLLQERTLSLSYEPEQSQRKRSPDFAVTYTTSLTFMVEVTRLRSSQGISAAPTRALFPAELSSPLPGEQERLADAVCSKLGQMLPQRANILIASADIPSFTKDDLQAIMLRIQQRAERNDSSYWSRYGFRDRADFFSHFYRLSEVLVRASTRETNQPTIVWINPQARVPLPGRVRTALYRSHGL